MSEDTDKIRNLNDRFRRGDPTVPGLVVATHGINALVSGDQSVRRQLLDIVKALDTFTPDNDLYGEHDFGTFEFRDEKCFWKIEVFDPSLEMAALDPGDPKLSSRVLTIMLASEY